MSHMGGSGNMLVGALSGRGMAAVAGEERGGGAGQFLTSSG
jgi:hypothetical protein